ncbi:hypothetical protein ACSBR2_011748 [Camellia fascicularis]
MLKKLEQHIHSQRRGFAYEILLTLYASLGNKDELYRIWNLCKQMGKIYNRSYFRMISSLVKLDDLDGAEKILVEWESVNMSFDFDIPNLLINAYCKKGLLEKAEMYISRAIERGKKPTAGTWDPLAIGYYKDNQMAKAVEIRKKAIMADQRGWKLNYVTLTACVVYLKETGDMEVAEFTRLKRPVPWKRCNRTIMSVSGRNSQEDGRRMEAAAGVAVKKANGVWCEDKTLKVKKADYGKEQAGKEKIQAKEGPIKQRTEGVGSFGPNGNTKKGTYAEVVKGSSVIGGSEVRVKAEEYGNDWLYYSTIAKMRVKCSVAELKKEFQNRGLVDVKIREGGGRIVYMTFRSGEDMKTKMIEMGEWIHDWCALRGETLRFLNNI